MLHGPRRILVIAVSFIAVPVVIPIATSAAPPSFVAAPSVDQPPLAQRGDRSLTVKRMQQSLVKAGVKVTGGADGLFGAATEAAVREYQTRRGLTVNGTLDVPTAIVLGMVKGVPILRRGARGEAVRTVQQQLMTVGLALKGGADGVYGSATTATLKAFQKSKGLVANGALDAGTAEILANAAAAVTPGGGVPSNPPSSTDPPATIPPPVAPPTTAPPTTPNGVLLSVGSRGEAVKAMQKQLIAVGITVFGGADGVFGSATKSSLKQFQTRVGLPVTGVFDSATQDALIAAALATTPDAPPATAPPPVAPPTTAPPTTAPPTTAPPTTPNGVLLSVGSRGEAVKAMQKQLIAVGIAVFGGADGMFGSATQSSLKQFQTRVGLPVTGVLDSATQDALVATALVPSPPAVTVVLAAFPVAPTCAFTDTFGAPRSGGRTHEGVDLMVASGTAIYAVMNGTISKKQVNYVGSLGGNALWLGADDGSYFYYAHLSAFAPGIEVGSVVTAGTLIGYVGATGNASVPHLHFEVHPGGGSAVNPYPIAKAASGC